jgi:hypothetical protein
MLNSVKKGSGKLKKGEWTFITNHGRVFIYIAKNPQCTTPQIAQEANLSLRAVQKIITDLDILGYLVRHKEGRCNRYTIHPEKYMRHPLESDHTVGDILIALGYIPEPGSKYGKAIIL